MSKILAAAKIDDLRRAVNVALNTPATDPAWDLAEAALDAVADDQEAMAQLVAAGASPDDVDCARFVELSQTLGRAALPSSHLDRQERGAVRSRAETPNRLRPATRDEQMKKLLKVASTIAAAMLVSAAATAQTNVPAGKATPGPSGQTCPSVFDGGVAPGIQRPQLRSRTTILCRKSFAVAYSGITKGPLWVAEHVEPIDGKTSAAATSPPFYAEAGAPAADRATTVDYEGSKYYHGRLAPLTWSGSAEDSVDRSSLATVVPMAPGLEKGLWPAIEGAIRDVASRTKGLWVVSGPAYHGSKVETIGSSGVLVPTAVWRAVLDPAKSATAVYVCTNRNNPICNVISVDMLVRETGIDPFPGTPPPEKAVAMDMPKPEASPYKDE